MPEWFIKLFTKPGDVVLDPFVGSGTTAFSALQLGRHFVGIDISPEYVQLSSQRVFEKQVKLPIIGEKNVKYIVPKKGKK